MAERRGRLGPAGAILVVAIILLGSSLLTPASAAPVRAGSVAAAAGLRPDSRTTGSVGGSGFAYVLDYSSANVTVVNATSLHVVTHVYLGLPLPSPRGDCFSPVTDEVYVADFGSYTHGLISIINASTNHLTRVIRDRGMSPWSCVFDPVTGDVFVANYGSASVTEIGRNDSIVRVLSVAALPDALAVDPFTGRLFVLCAGSSSATNSPSYLLSIAVTNGTRLATIRIGLSVYPSALAFDAHSQQLYVGNDGTSWWYNASTYSLVKISKIGPGGGFPVQAIDSPWSSNVTVAGGIPLVFNMTLDRLGRTISLPYAYGCGVDPNSHNLFLTGGGSLWEFSPTTHRIGQVSFGTFLTGVAVAY